MALVESSLTERDDMMRRISQAVDGMPFTSANFESGGVNIIMKDTTMNDVFSRVSIQRDRHALRCHKCGSEKLTDTEEA